MLQSHLFTKTRKENPKDEVSKNASLLVRGGFLNKEMAGVYDYLPLGLLVLKKIENIIREEMNAIGGQEIFMSSLQDPEIWKASNRWSEESVDVWFKSKFQAGGEVGFANTHEEPLTNLLKQHISSYKDLPLYIYQFQTKFRNELRAKSGIMRTREFVMKDLYSFSRSEDEFREFYEKCALSYLRIFERVGLGKITYRTFASGGSFSKFSDEFQTISDAGEDTIYIDNERRIGINKEVYSDDILLDLGLKKEQMIEKKSIEVGNIFPLGTRFGEALSLYYKDQKGQDQIPFMGSYGIGLGRLMGVVVEVFSDSAGIIWPKSIAPFDVHVIVLGERGSHVFDEASDLYKNLLSYGLSVLFDERDMRAGEKFAESDLLGIPFRIVVSEKSNREEGYEVKKRENGEISKISRDNLQGFLTN